MQLSKLVLAFSFSALMLASLPASATQPADWHNPNLPLIVITPTKSDRDIDSVPYAVSVISREQKNQTQAQSFDDALRRVPNLDAAGGPRTASEEPSIRGLSDRRVVIKVDGIRRNFRGQYGGRYFIDPYLVNRIEVVRGANSAIDGSGAIGGVMQLFTPSVAQQLQGSAKNHGGSITGGFQSGNTEYSTALMGYGQAELDPGTSADILGAFSYRNGSNIRTGGGNKIASSGDDPSNALVKTGVNFGPKHRAEVRLAKYRNDSFMPVSPFQPVSASNSAAVRQSEVRDISFNYRLAPSNEAVRNIFDLTTTVYHSELRQNTRRYSDRRLDQTKFTTLGTDTYNTASFAVLGLPSKLMAGVEYYENEQTGKRNGGFRPLLGDGKDHNTGLYAQYEVTLFNQLTFMPGVRYDMYELTPENSTLPSNSENKWSPKLGVNWQITNSWSAFGSLSKAFRTPTLTELYATGTLFPGNTLVANPNLQPETATNHEAGLRYDGQNLISANDSLRVRAAVFENEIDNYIEQIIGSTTTQFRNVTQAKLKGAELEVQYRLGQYGISAMAAGVRGDNKTLNQPLADVPADHYSMALERYSFDYQLTTGIRANYTAAQNRTPPGQPLITDAPDATTFDIYASYEPNTGGLEGMRVNVGVDNMLDKRYTRYLAFIPETGRNIKATLNWEF